MMAVNGRQLSEAEKIDLTRCYAESDRQMMLSRRQQALLAAAGMMEVERRWAIIRVEARRENDVDNLLSRAMIEHWLPLRKADFSKGGKRRGAPGQAVWTLAWPGYMLVKIPDTPEAWQGLASVKHVRKILGVGERPFFMDDAKFLRLKAELATLRPCNGRPTTMFIEGERVLVVDGPFASFPGTVVATDEEKGNGRALVEVMIFGRAVPVELDLAQLAKT